MRSSFTHRGNSAHPHIKRIAVGTASAALAIFLTAAIVDAAEKVNWNVHKIGKYRGEVCDVADFNNDKVLDIVAGNYIYLGPKFEAVQIRDVKTDINEEGKGYDWDFMNAPLDVDGDGLLDVVSCSWFGQNVEWYRNPLGSQVQQGRRRTLAGDRRAQKRQLRKR